MWLYHWVLRLCPHDFRDQCGAALEEMLAHRLADLKTQSAAESDRRPRRRRPPPIG
jgi:hypothetical protein